MDVDELVRLLLSNGLSYPDFITQIHRTGATIEVTCEFCGKQYMFEPQEYLGKDHCGCIRMVVTQMNGQPVLVRCPDIMSLNFFSFVTWWKSLNYLGVSN